MAKRKAQPEPEVLAEQAQAGAQADEQAMSAMDEMSSLSLYDAIHDPAVAGVSLNEEGKTVAVFAGHPPQPLRISEIVTYVSETPYGLAYLPAVVASIHPDHVGLRVYCDKSGGSEWPVNSQESVGPKPGSFYRS
jgi:hypothetical protein